MNSNYLKLCLVTHAKTMPFIQYKKIIIAAVKGGVTSVQLREKDKNKQELYQMASELKSILMPFRIPLIINDDVEIAKEINADGIHLGQTDCDPPVAREYLGPEKIIGLSIESMKELKHANELACLNYVAASAVFVSKTKPDCKKIWGLSGLQEIMQITRHPVIAIGGIHVGNVTQVIESGTAGVAVVDAIHSQNDPESAAQELLAKINLAGDAGHV